MSSHMVENYIPLYGKGTPIKVRPIEEMKMLILESNDVKEAIA